MKNIIEGTEKGSIVFIHGNSSSAEVFNTVLQSPVIKQKKVAIELPGHGDNINRNSKIEHYSNSSLCKNLIHEINSIESDILLVGNSLGGHLAIEISNHIKGLKGLLICGTPPVKNPINFNEAFIPIPELQTFFKEYPSDIELETAAERAVSDKVFIDQIKKDFNRADPLVRRSLAIDITENNWSDQFEIFIHLNIPKFIIAGLNDPSINKGYLEKVSKLCQNTCEIFEINNCGHYPSLEKPEKFIEILQHVTKRIFKP